jgi:hypothetical protein
MKNNIIFSGLFLSLILCSILFADEPFAPVVDIPENPKNDPDLMLAIAFLNDVQVPDKDAVGVPAYPEAKIFQTTKAQAGMLPTVRLLSADEVSVVVEFYKKELTDWKHKDFYGIQYFYNGEEQKAMFGQEPLLGYIFDTI